jgi:hypothetical protein
MVLSTGDLINGSSEEAVNGFRNLRVDHPSMTQSTILSIPIGVDLPISCSEYGMLLTSHYPIYLSLVIETLKGIDMFHLIIERRVILLYLSLMEARYHTKV